MKSNIETLSDAEVALRRKYKVLREKQALQKLRERNQAPQTEEGKSKLRFQRDVFRSRNWDAARQEAIKIIRSRRLAATGGSQIGQKQSGNTKIKLSLPKAKPSGATDSPVKETRKPTNWGGISDMDSKQVETRKKPQISKKYAGAYRKKQDKAAEQPKYPPTPTLFIANLPEYYTSETLMQFFVDLMSVDVVDARVNEGFCSGLVTFGTFEEAESVLDFQKTQQITLEDRPILVSWARASDLEVFDTMPEPYRGSVDPHSFHPRMRDAVATASKVASQITEHNLEGIEEHLDPRDAGRHVVSYDDL
eukprot:jgi/Picsp_1/365/NSC_00363-R1_polyadenylate binding protein